MAAFDSAEDHDRAPLLSTQATHEHEHENVSLQDPEPEAKGNWLWILTFTADDTASISSALLYLSPALSTPTHSVTTLDLSLITSATSFGALLGGLSAGILADRLGRKGVIYLADALFLIGALWQAVSTTVVSMICGRLIVGVGVGVGSLVVPLYISELAPASHRGRLVVVDVLCITIGQVVAYAVGILLGPRWRWVLGLGAVPAVIQAVLMILMPETPRWLVSRGRRKEAAEVLSLVYGTDDPSVISSLLAEIGKGVTSTSTSGLKDKLTQLIKIPGNRRALTIACLLQFLQQACGFNTLMYFSATVFSMIGFKNPTVVAMVVAGTNAIFTGVAFGLIDKVGRRKMLLMSLGGMTFGLVLVAAAFGNMPDLIKGVAIPAPETFPAVVMVLAIIIFVSFYALGLGNIPWLCQSEFFPMEVRGLGTGAATAMCWGSNMVVAGTFLGLLETLGGRGTFVGYAEVCALGFLVCWGIYPETRGMGMEEIEGLLRSGWGVEGRG
ncbi:Similar to Myo-inositol transporter 1; acc. no. Q10286 [Pyronema omphalodes CBS 100304]|uniref:Similar to Myo-inositol transporter 1 acc. no. Q10286 n=1 Tax=Pyronema omphalodes (strain CBS 100304) TaxID=1076935 RepID=U4KW16_PYROM|nr:Similar to Myo-inositol transporter 1; acc. no. Q10286 [Pyronema omphalodes CBS 100304]